MEAARGLFHEKGYASTSMRDILREAGANSGSLYHFFPTKQDLLGAVLRNYEKGIRPMLVDPAWAGVNDPVERVFALLAQYRGLLLESGCTYGCPIGNLALEMHEPDPPIRRALAANFRAWIAVVKECLDAAALPAGLDRSALAVFVLTTMEGAVMLARTFGTLEPFDAAVAQLRDHFHRLLQKGPKP